jgi:class 3 adenylate cyclase/pimeloyl-ACP methyl ester carboxylesterase
MADVARKLAAIMFTDLVGYTSLMGDDEQRAIAVVERSRVLIRSQVEAHGGRCLEHEGDGTLSIFPSAVEAVVAASDIQAAAARDALELRIGVHVGDVIESGDRIVGDGVNVASRICSLASARQIYVSETVYDQVRNQRDFTGRRVGAPALKNVSRPVVVWSIETDAKADENGKPGRRRIRPLRLGGLALGAAILIAAIVIGLDADLRNGLAAAAILSVPGLAGPNLEREIAFTHSADRTRIAWASVGAGPPIVQVQVWATHVEYGPMGPVYRLPALAERHRIVYYDGRGFGLSQRDVDHDFDRRIEDLEAVIDAAGLERFAGWGFSGGTPTAIAYTVKHPERVSHLVLYGTVLRRPIDAETFRATESLIRQHWGSSEPAFRDFFRGLIVPDATDFQMSIFNRMMGDSGTAQDAADFWVSGLGRDVTDLTRQIRVPTLVMHRRDDVLVPFDLGLETASLIPGARFIALEGKNHVFLPDEAEGDRAIEAIEAFVAVPGG